MATASARCNDYFEPDVSPAADAARRSNYPNFSRHYHAEPERKWEVEVVQALVRLANMPAGWDSYNAPPLRRDAGHFALEILQSVMRPRTPLPQVVPSAAGGVQLEWQRRASIWNCTSLLHINGSFGFAIWRTQILSQYHLS